MSTTSSTPTNKEIVTALCEKIDSGKNAKGKGYNTWKCVSCTRAITCNLSQGYHNAYSHILKCMAGGVTSLLQEQYCEKIGSTSGSASSQKTLTYFAKCVKSIALMKWVKYIVLLLQPLSHIENDDMRNFTGFKHNVSNGAVKDVILELVKLVEEVIKAEIVSYLFVVYNTFLLSLTKESNSQNCSDTFIFTRKMLMD